MALSSSYLLVWRVVSTLDWKMFAQKQNCDFFVALDWLRQSTFLWLDSTVAGMSFLDMPTLQTDRMLKKVE